MSAFEPVASPLLRWLSMRVAGARPFPALAASRRGFSLTEVLVVATVIAVLGSLAAGAVSMAASSQKKLLTKTLIAKIDVTISAQYASYAGRNVVATSGTARGAALRAMAAGDLPDSWTSVDALSRKADSELTTPQRSYVAVWNSLTDADRQRVPQANSSAECLFLIVMYGGLVDCLDCASLRLDVGDQDGDDMPEFLDAWDNPIGFVLWPCGLRLPSESSQLYFAVTNTPDGGKTIVKPFDPVLPSAGDSQGGVMRPLIYSAGPDGDAGLKIFTSSTSSTSSLADPLADPVPPTRLTAAAPLAGSTAARDNLTNFDEEAKR